MRIINFRTDARHFSFGGADEPMMRGRCFMADEGAEDGGGGGSGGEGGEGDAGGEEGGEQIQTGLMQQGDDEGGKGEEGDKDSGHTIDHDGTAINVPEKFWTKDGDKLNEGAVLTAAMDAGKTVRQLQNELAEAKKNGNPDQDKEGIPEDVAGYLADNDGEDPFIKDGFVQLKGSTGKLQPVPIDDPVLGQFAQIAKDEGLSKERFERIVGKVLLGVEEHTPDGIDVAAEAEKFGPTAKAVAGTNKAWADNMLTTGELSKSEHAQLVNMGQTAVGLSLVNKMRMQTGGKNIPNPGGGIAGELPSKEEWMRSKPNHNTEPDAFAKWQEQGEQIFGTEPAGSSDSGLGAPANQGGSRQAYENQNGRGRTGGHK